jgi:CRISPR-associated protein Cas2
MSLSVLVTRDVAARFRGFLASVLCEVAPGVYISADMNAAVRDRVWAVMEEWWESLPGAAAVLVYPSKEAAGRLAVRTLGLPPVELADIDGIRVAVRGRSDSSS